LKMWLAVLPIVQVEIKVYQLEIHNLTQKMKKQGKKVCKPTAFRCYQCFSLRLFVFVCWRANWLPPEK